MQVLAAADPLTAGERGDPAPIKAVGIFVVDVLDTRRSDFGACPAQERCPALIDAVSTTCATRFLNDNALPDSAAHQVLGSRSAARPAAIYDHTLALGDSSERHALSSRVLSGGKAARCWPLCVLGAWRPSLAIPSGRRISLLRSLFGAQC